MTEYNGLRGKDFIRPGVTGITDQAMALLTGIEKEAKKISLEIAVIPKDTSYNRRLEKDLTNILDRRYYQLKTDCETLSTPANYLLFLEYAKNRIQQARNAVPPPVEGESLTRKNARIYREDLMDVVTAITSCDISYLKIKTTGTEKGIRRVATIYSLLTDYSVLSGKEENAKPAMRKIFPLKKRIERLRDTIKERILISYPDEDKLEERLAEGSPTLIIDNIVHFESTGVVLALKRIDEAEHLARGGTGIEVNAATKPKEIKPPEDNRDYLSEMLGVEDLPRRGDMPTEEYPILKFK